MNGAPSEGLCITEQRPSTCRMVQPAARKRRSHGPSRRAEHRGSRATRHLRQRSAAALTRGCRIKCRECARLLSGGRRVADSGRNRARVPVSGGLGRSEHRRPIATISEDARSRPTPKAGPAPVRSAVALSGDCGRPVVHPPIGASGRSLHLWRVGVGSRQGRVFVASALTVAAPKKQDGEIAAGPAAPPSQAASAQEVPR